MPPPGFVAGPLTQAFPLADLDLVLLGHPLLNEERLALLRTLRSRAGCPPVIVFAADGDEFLAVDAMKAGAADYFPKSRITHQRLVRAVRGRFRERRRRGLVRHAALSRARIRRCWAGGDGLGQPAEHHERHGGGGKRFGRTTPGWRSPRRRRSSAAPFTEGTRPERLHPGPFAGAPP